MSNDSTGYRIIADMEAPAGLSDHDAQIALVRQAALAKRWDQLCDQLAAIKDARGAPQANERRLVSEAQAAVIEFFDGDPWALQEGISWPFKRLLAGLHNLEQGAHEKLFKPRNVSHRPTGLAGHQKRGLALGLVEQIALTGRTEGAAAVLVADELHRLGVRRSDLGLQGGRAKITSQALLNCLHHQNKQPQTVRDELGIVRDAAPAMRAEGEDGDVLRGLLLMLAAVANWS